MLDHRLYSKDTPRSATPRCYHMPQCMIDQPLPRITTNLLWAAFGGTQRGHPVRERRKTMTARKSGSKPSTPPKYRRADTGKYTTKRYADKHPKTTVKESK